MNSFSNILSGLAIAAALITAPIAASALAAPGQGSGPVTVGPGQRSTGADRGVTFFVPADFMQVARAYAPKHANGLATYLAYKAEPGLDWSFVGPGGQVGPFLLTPAQLHASGYTRSQALADPVVQVRVHLMTLKSAATRKHLSELADMIEAIDLRRGE